MNRVTDTLKNIRPTLILEAVFKMLTSLAAGYYIILFLYIGFSRFSYPFLIEWVESPILIEVNRVLLGQKLYVEPSAAYIPLIYPPLYIYASAALAKLMGLSFAPLRLISIISSAGTMLIILLLTKRLVGSWFAGMVAAGLFAATNGIVWAWFDFARVDMLGIFLSMLGIYFLIKNDMHSAILAGIFFALAFFTKQSALISALPVLTIYFFVERKSSLFAGFSFGLSVLIGTFLLALFEGKWYFLYTQTLPSNHRLDTNPKQIEYIVTSLLEPIIWFGGLICLAVLTNLKKFFRERRLFFILVVTLSTLVFSIIISLGFNSTRNGFIPAYAYIAVLFGVSLHLLLEKVSNLPASAVKAMVMFLIFGICLWQFSTLVYFKKPRDYLPTSYDLKRGQALIKYLEEDGESFIAPSDNYLALLVSQKTYYHESTFAEFKGGYGGITLPESDKIIQEIQEAVRSGEVKYVYWLFPSREWAGMTCDKIDVFRSKSKFVPTLYKMKCYPAK